MQGPKISTVFYISNITQDFQVHFELDCTKKFD